ncbi:hypothetical protein [Persicobacter psychrovividus]|uniref:Uncharacterized protein n=1 Tax=Persicobacter psychrovividus TaxID=387638 RepID=A0ABM7VLD7_9BACT|nr:hypothetical protein PEPS_40940 [Persicobacter psychrovividus]
MIYDLKTKTLYRENGEKLKSCHCSSCKAWEEFRFIKHVQCPNCGKKILHTAEFQESDLAEFPEEEFCFKYQIGQENISFIY